MKFLILSGLFLGIINLCEGNYGYPLTITTPEVIPYMAYVRSDLYCLGALISTTFVVVNAVCIASRGKATVYLGATTMPFYDFLGLGNKNMQKIKSVELITHPGYSKRIDNDALVNNIGLIKLADAAAITSNVRPAILPKPWNFPLSPGLKLNVSGYMDTLFFSNQVRMMTVTVQPQTECHRFYGKYLQGDEQCAIANGDRMDWPGPFVVNNVLVGMARALANAITCVAPRPPCYSQDVFLTLGPFVEWINYEAGFPILVKNPQ